VSLNNYPISALSLRWLYVDFNSYFASVEQQLRPELRGQPIAVVPVETDSTCAIAASYEAKAFGVKTGTPIYEAKRLCPGLTCVLARHERYVEFHHRLIEEIERHIPVTAVCSIDEVASRLMDK
jgi:DNA polymerase-4